MMNNAKKLLLGGSLLGIALSLTSCGDQTAAPAGGGAAPSAEVAPGVPAGDLEEIKPKFPKPLFQGTPVPAGKVANLEEPVGEDKVQKSFKAPKGTANVALNKKVTSSDEAIIIPAVGDEALKLITDGDADSSDGCFVEMAPGPQWVQIDLEAPHTIHQLLVWHFHKQTIIVKGFVVQVSDDATFKTGVTTIYNADIENGSGQGVGADKAWVQTNHGRFVNGKGAKGRYVRLWSNGSTYDDFNRLIEVEVYATK
jgi:F5/8 type C domain